ncbi:Outer membrane protein assembly factor BamB [Caulifigura coniformis]|uniref:Outer membrane protein assembly factor BamB n=1 Tax=Caulifigura coniformis TaxID=2527983 RepID=A0A517SL33_9PLAN|nr:PQQ-binding-like beta-propeller repeat protein [Caulifigura coniformis]QDT56830.1 Outer membrane protein assembly factor BamB [Caulifigura coniformis]
MDQSLINGIRNGAGWCVATAACACVAASIALAQGVPAQRLILPGAQRPVPVEEPAIGRPAAPIRVRAAAPAAEGRSESAPLDTGLTTSEELERLLERATQVAVERPDLAPVLWQRILDEGANAFARAELKNQVPLRRQYEIFRPFSNESLRAIVAAGPEAVRHYRLQSDGPARVLMARQGEDREAALAEIVRRYFLTTIGDDAAFELGCRLLERGDVTSADHLFDRLSLYPDSSIEPDAITVRRAVTQSRLGRQKVAVALVESLGQEFDDLKPMLLNEVQERNSPSSNKGQSAGTPVMPGDLTGEALEPDWEFRPAWTLKGVKASANNEAIMSGISNGRPMIFVRQPGGNYSQTTLDDKNVPDLTLSQLATAWRGGTWRPASSPVVVDGRLYLKSESRTVCCSASTGEVLWMGRPTRFPINEMTRQLALVASHGVNVPIVTTTYIAGLQPKTLTEIMLFSERLHHEVTVSGGRVYVIEGDLDTPSVRKKATENVVERQMFGGPMPTHHARPNELACYDAKTGRLIWTVASGGVLPAGSTVCSKPLVAGSLLLVAVGIDSQLALVAIESSNGSVVWKTNLADLGGAWQPIPVGLAVDDGSVYVASGSGTLFSVDRNGGTLRWAVSYPRLKSSAMERRVIEGNPGQRIQIVFDENFLACEEGAIVLAAADCDHVMSFDVTDGALRWDSPIPPTSLSGAPGYVVGMANGRIYLANNKTLWSISTRGGRILWDLSLDGACGRGLLTSDSLFVPQQQTVTQVDPETGRTLNKIACAMLDSEPVGNLVADGNRLLVASAARLIAMKPKATRIEEAPGQEPKSPPTGGKL